MRLSILQDETELEGTQEVIIRTDLGQPKLLNLIGLLFIYGGASASWMADLASAAIATVLGWTVGLGRTLG